MAERTQAGGQRWAARPWAARIVKAIAFLAPIVLSVLISLAISRRIDPPSSRLAQIGWWIVLSAIATAILFVFDKISRRLLPLSTLFGLSLIFPDQAPSRFRTALRTGTVSQLKKKIEDAKANGLSDEPSIAAETLVELAGALSIHDRLTRGHSERVRAYTKLIAEEMGLPEDEVDRLQWAGLAHDVGKLFVDGDILNKPGRLTDEEFETIKTHTVKGADLVAPLRGWLGDALDAVDQHHERWDGKGYPAGLARTDIALPGRIVAVADVFDVITSVRSYKSAQGVAEAREELIRCSGTQFDPRVVRAFLNIGLGRLRLLVGPLSWLAQLPVVGRAPVGAAAAPAIAALGTSFSLLFGGFFADEVPNAPREEVITLTAAPAPVPTTPTTVATVSTTTTAPSPVPVMARADAVTTAEDTPVSIDVLTNDDGELLLDSVSTPRPAGSATVIDGGRVRFTPDTDWSGTATFAYRARGADGVMRLANVTVDVVPVSDSPRTGADRATLTEDGDSITIGVLANDSSPEGGTLRITAVSTDQGGTASTDGTTVTFVPDADQHGTVTLTYTVVDERGVRATGTITLTIDPVNDAPAAADDFTRIDEDTPWALIDVRANDRDVDGDPLVVTGVRGAALGTATMEGGRIRYVPAPNANGTEILTYTAADGRGGLATAVLTIIVTPIEDAPTVTAGPGRVVTEDSGAHTRNGWATGIGPGGGADEAGQTLTATTSATNPGLFAALPAVNVATGTLTFTPAPDANGASLVTLVVSDGNVKTTVTATIRVLAVDDAPVLVPGPDQSVVEDAGVQSRANWAVAVGPGGGPDEASQTLTAVTTVANPGLVSAASFDAATGTLTYRPATDANGSTTVTLELSDGANTTTRTFTITINPVADTPTAGDDSATVAEDDPATVIDVLANDADVDGDPLTITSVTGATLGTATTDGTTITYTPNPDANGTDTLTTTIDDGNGTPDTATLTITITPVNDAPVASDDNFAAAADVPLAVAAPGLLASDSDVELDPMAVTTTPVVAPAQGSVSLSADGSFTYTPPSASFGGEVWFTYEVTDGQGGSDTATVTIQVSPASGAGVYFLGSSTSTSTSPLNTTPGAPASPEPDHPGDFDADPGVTIRASSGNLEDTDVTKFQHWTLAPTTPLSLRGPTRLHLWSTVSGFYPDDDGHYHVWLSDCADDGTDCEPIAGPTDAHVDKWNRGTSGWVLRTIDIGSVDRTIMPGRMLRMRLMFQHNDMWIALSGTRPSSLELTLGNATPLAITDTMSVLEDSGTTNIDVLANDRDEDLVRSTVTITAPPVTGTAVALGDGTIGYTPAADRVGSDTFSYEACDSIGQCATSTVNVTISGVNDQPSFQPGGPASADEDDGTTSVNAWATSIDAGPTDEDATQTVWFEVTNDNPGLFLDQPEIEPDGKLTFKGADDAFGTATVTVVLRDSGGTASGGVDASAPAVFTITINPLPDEPTAVDDVAVVDQDFFVNILVKQNDVDPDGDTLTVASFTPGADGTVTLNGDGSLRYTPDPGFFGSDNFDYVISDGFGGFDTGRVDVSVNRTPVAVPDTYVVLLGDSTLDVTANDLDDSPLVIAQVDTTTTNGTVACGATTCTFRPPGIGSDSFSYRLRDPRGVWSNWTTVSILVTA